MTNLVDAKNEIRLANKPKRLIFLRNLQTKLSTCVQISPHFGHKNVIFPEPSLPPAEPERKTIEFDSFSVYLKSSTNLSTKWNRDLSECTNYHLILRKQFSTKNTNESIEFVVKNNFVIVENNYKKYLSKYLIDRRIKVKRNSFNRSIYQNLDE